MTPAQISVLIVDDHPVVTAGLASMVEKAPDMRLTGVAHDLAQARALVEVSRPDVVLSDVILGPAAHGFELLDGQLAVIMLTLCDYPSMYALAIERGAAGYLLKSTPADQILDAIRRVARGETVFSREMMRTAKRAPRRPSQRELQVVSLVASERTTAQIAHALGLSERTVETHLHRMFQRYGVSNRTGLAMLAQQQGWIRPRA